MGTRETMNIPNWNGAYKHLNWTLPKDHFRQKFTASPCSADAVARQLRNLSPHPQTRT